jgi:hypothetical protein
MVSAEQRERYQRDGIVHLPGAFANWVDALLGAIDRVVARSQEPGYVLQKPFRFAPQSPLRVAGGAGGVTVGGTMALHAVPHDPVLERWVHESPAAALAGEITGSEVMRYWQDAIFMKYGGGEGQDGTPWHNDYCTWPFRGEKLPILWIALTDVGPEDAPLVTVRGSHTDPWRYYSPMSPPGLPVTDEYHAWEELLARPTAPGAVLDTWTVRAGDALLMHSKIIHCSEPRRSVKPGRRVSFSTRWLGDDAIWGPDAYSYRIEPLLADARMRPGEAPPAALFPPVWVRERAAA